MALQAGVPQGGEKLGRVSGNGGSGVLTRWERSQDAPPHPRRPVGGLRGPTMGGRIVQSCTNEGVRPRVNMQEPKGVWRVSCRSGCCYTGNDAHEGSAGSGAARAARLGRFRRRRRAGAVRGAPTTGVVHGTVERQGGGGRAVVSRTSGLASRRVRTAATETVCGRGERKTGRAAEADAGLAEGKWVGAGEGPRARRRPRFVGSPLGSGRGGRHGARGREQAPHAA